MIGAAQLRSGLGYLREALLPALLARPAEADYCVSVERPLGRYWIHVVQPLTACGGAVSVVGAFPRRDYVNPDLPGAAPARLPGVRFSLTLPRRTPATTLLAESTQGRLGRRRWAKRLRLSFDVYDDCRAAEPFYRLPYGIHPWLTVQGWDAQFPAQRAARRTARVLFSGNTDPLLYDTEEARPRNSRYGIELNRFEAVNALEERFTGDQLLVAAWEGEDLPRLFDGSCREKLFMVRWNGYRGLEWPRALGAADFFLALPGVFMPMCHNVAEAMAAGCVPITNYPDWFTPGLVDGENCLVFSDADSLVAAVERALAMPVAEVERLRANAAAYFDRHLAPATVPAALDALPDGATVYLLTEDRDALAKVGRGSIAYPGPRPALVHGPQDL